MGQYIQSYSLQIIVPSNFNLYFILKFKFYQGFWNNGILSVQRSAELIGTTFLYFTIDVVMYSTA